jgi:hypothetical protein
VTTLFGLKVGKGVLEGVSVAVAAWWVFMVVLDGNGVFVDFGTWLAVANGLLILLTVDVGFGYRNYSSGIRSALLTSK